MLPVSQFAKELHLIMLTATGQIKRTPLSLFSKINNRGIIAMKLKVGPLLQSTLMDHVVQSREMPN
jgi:DNA gyrase/topoisomerase IV subunit A